MDDTANPWTRPQPMPPATIGWVSQYGADRTLPIAAVKRELMEQEAAANRHQKSRLHSTVEPKHKPQEVSLKR